ncbi:MAG: tyrosine-type recombinase/integrase [Defluviitaleaceae bacterium]|nr:tyrosine-type recombinase/integrase [Defluviitaleaceae bacterium]
MASIVKIKGKKGISYRLVAYLGYDKNGKQITKTKTYKPNENQNSKQTEKQALYEAIQFENNLKYGINTNSKIIFEEYSKIWLENNYFAYTTKVRYEVLLKRINKHIGHLKLENINTYHLREFYKHLYETEKSGREFTIFTTKLKNILQDKKITQAELSRNVKIPSSTLSDCALGKNVSIETATKISKFFNLPLEKIFNIEEKKKLSDITIVQHHRLICGILSSAKRERLITYNVALEHTSIPKAKSKESTYLDDKEAKKLVELLLKEEDIRVKTCIALTLYTGARRGEICGLSWNNIDKENSTIHILKQSQYQKDKGIVETELKSESSKRVISVPPFIFSLLNNYKIWYNEQKLKLGIDWQGDSTKNGKIFIQKNGKPISPNTINLWINNFIKKHDLKHFTPHSLRHTFATLQIMHGVNIRTVQSRMGHSKASTLLNIYSHSIKEFEEQAKDAIDTLTPKEYFKNNI